MNAVIEETPFTIEVNKIIDLIDGFDKKLEAMKSLAKILEYTMEDK